jgi:hypothetical protein
MVIVLILIFYKAVHRRRRIPERTPSSDNAAESTICGGETNGEIER